MFSKFDHYLTKFYVWIICLVIAVPMALAVLQQAEHHEDAFILITEIDTWAELRNIWGTHNIYSLDIIADGIYDVDIYWGTGANQVDLDDVCDGGSTTDQSITIQGTSKPKLQVESSDASDPCITLKTTNTAHDLYMCLDESSVHDHLNIVGQTAGVNTGVHIHALDGYQSEIELYSGTNKSQIIHGSADNLSIRNATADKNIVFNVNDSDGDSTTTITINAANAGQLRHETGTFDFHDDHILTAGAFYATNTATGIYKDPAGNMNFYDAVTGGKTLAELATGGGNETLAETLALGADANDLDITSLNNLAFIDSAVKIYGGIDGRLDIEADTTLNLGTTATTTNVGKAGSNVIVGGTTPDSLFEVDGPEGLAIQTVTGNTTLDNTHSTLLVNASGNVIITLAAAASCYNNTDGIGRLYEIKKIDADADTVTIDGNGSETIDGATTAVITTQYESITIQTDGSNWHIL